jgi:hypothetical protein
VILYQKSTSPCTCRGQGSSKNAGGTLDRLTEIQVRVLLHNVAEKLYDPFGQIWERRMRDVPFPLLYDAAKALARMRLVRIIPGGGYYRFDK